MENLRTIRVMGRGDVTLRPDLTRLTITLQGTEVEYAAALERSAKEAGALKDALAAVGFDREALKTLAFAVDAKYEGYQDEKGQWRQRFLGYEFTHELKVEFACENALLGRTLYALSHAGTDALFRIGYTVRDPEAAKAALLAHAMHDAAEKARVLAEASGVALGAIQSIEHSRGEVSLEVQPVNRMFASDAAPLGKAAYDVDFTPDDIQVSDTVTAVWEIL